MTIRQHIEESQILATLLGAGSGASEGAPGPATRGSADTIQVAEAGRRDGMQVPLAGAAQAVRVTLEVVATIDKMRKEMISHLFELLPSFDVAKSHFALA